MSLYSVPQQLFTLSVALHLNVCPLSVVLVVFVRWCSSLLDFFDLIYQNVRVHDEDTVNLASATITFSSALLFGLKRKGFLCGFKATCSLVNTGLTYLVFVRLHAYTELFDEVVLLGSFGSLPRFLVECRKKRQNRDNMLFG